MTATTLKTVEELLSKLSDDDAKKVLNNLKARFHLTPSKAPEQHNRDEDDWLLLGIVQVLRKLGKVKSDWLPSKELRKKLAPNYEEKAAEARAHLLEHIQNPTRSRLRALGKLAAMSLVDWLHDRDYEVTARNMLLYIGHVPRAIDAAFPGYIANGMLGIIIQWDHGTDG